MHNNTAPVCDRRVPFFCSAAGLTVHTLSFYRTGTPLGKRTALQLFFSADFSLRCCDALMYSVIDNAGDNCINNI